MATDAYNTNSSAMGEINWGWTLFGAVALVCLVRFIQVIMFIDDLGTGKTKTSWILETVSVMVLSLVLAAAGASWKQASFGARTALFLAGAYFAVTAGLMNMFRMFNF